MGRRKIKIELVKNSSARQVTFSKRRNGLFQKAYELVTLCAAQMAVVVFSPGGKPYSFGHPTVESVFGRYLNREANEPSAAVHGDAGSSGQTSSDAETLSRRLDDLEKQLQHEKKRGHCLDEAIKAAKGEKYLKPINELSLDELIEFKQELEALREKLMAQAREIEFEAASSLLLLSEGPVK